jgi:hypothetical protein
MAFEDGAFIEFTGVEATIKAIRDKWYRTGIGLSNGLKSSMEMVLEETLPITPIEYGPLRESGHVEVVGSRFNAEASVVFDAPYAVYVHEDPDAYHEPPTQYKFLETTVRRLRSDIVKKVGYEIQEVKK